MKVVSISTTNLFCNLNHKWPLLATLLPDCDLVGGKWKRIARMPHTNALCLPFASASSSSSSYACSFLFGHFSHCHFVRHPFGCMRITLKYMEMAFYDKDSPDSITAISPIAKCKEGPINFLYDYYEYARMGEPIIANGAIH